MNKDMNLARNVQESLFPKIESIKGIKFAVFRKTTNLIGGDFYDFILLREGDIGIFITDVAGHGYSSAMVASMIKVLVSTIPYQFKLQPSALLNYLDEKISGEYKSHHASACYLYLNFKRREITYSNGGHPYLLYSKKGKDFETVEINGTLIGLGLKNIILEEKQFSFETGDRFFLYTDGLVENLNSRNNFLETEDLVKLLNELNHLDIKAMKTELLKKIQSFFDNLDFTDDSMFLIFEFEE